jgi:tripartite-type tricarboxylate transporter receptor subunit TctC
VVPYTTGGSNDVIARLLAQQLQEAWGQPVVVENKPGAAGNIGSSDIAKSAPDGHSLLLTNINIVSMNPGLIANMPFDPQKDFAPISLLGTTALALVVHPSVSANNVRELIDLARKAPGRLNYASSGNGSPQHMSAEMFKAMMNKSFVSFFKVIYSSLIYRTPFFFQFFFFLCYCLFKVFGIRIFKL